MTLLLFVQHFDSLDLIKLICVDIWIFVYHEMEAREGNREADFCRRSVYDFRGHLQRKQLILETVTKFLDC